jgi:hypothetical protein
VTSLASLTVSNRHIIGQNCFGFKALFLKGALVEESD